jgi:FAD synthase
VEFVSHLRPEQKFNSLNELSSQIAIDAHQARAILTQAL